MVDGRKLTEAVWPAINIEMMQSQAWSVCFEGEFRHDHYRQIVHVVVFGLAVSDPCTLGELQRKIADAFDIDDKTVGTRIEEMAKGGLLEISKDLNDRRKKLVTPTEKLVAAYSRYSDHLVDLQIEFRNQMDKRDRPRRVHNPTPSLYFDLLDHVEGPDVSFGGRAKSAVAPLRPERSEPSKDRK